MDQPPEGNVASESNDSSDNDNDQDEDELRPAFMSIPMRRQYLQEMVSSLPSSVQNRITALKNIQISQLKIEAVFFDELFDLEKRYQEQYESFIAQRKDIVTGVVEPPQQVEEWKLDPELKVEENNDFSTVMTVYKEIPETTKGIPDFWLTIFLNVPKLADLIQKQDEPLLKKLYDVRCIYGDKQSFKFEFYFEKNDYFFNDVLTKNYELKSEVHNDYPFRFEGPELKNCTGCKIDWKPTMNLTVRTLRKKFKRRENGVLKITFKQIRIDSFFNFFSPPDPTCNDLSEADKTTLDSDYDVATLLREDIVPKATLYYTGDAVDDDDSYDDDEEEESSSSDTDDDDDEENTEEDRVISRD